LKTAQASGTSFILKYPFLKQIYHEYSRFFERDKGNIDLLSSYK